MLNNKIKIYLPKYVFSNRYTKKYFIIQFKLTKHPVFK